MSEVKELRTVAHDISEMMYNISTSYIKDLNEATTPGLWLLDGEHSPQNAPQTGNFVCGILEVFGRYGNVMQRITTLAVATPNTAIRTCWNGNWTGWKIL